MQGFGGYYAWRKYQIFSIEKKIESWLVIKGDLWGVFDMQPYGVPGIELWIKVERSDKQNITT